MVRPTCSRWCSPTWGWILAPSMTKVSLMSGFGSTGSRASSISIVILFDSGRRRWSIATRVEEVTPEEMNERAAKMFGGAGCS